MVWVSLDTIIWIHAVGTGLFLGYYVGIDDNKDVSLRLANLFFEPDYGVYCLTI